MLTAIDDTVSVHESVLIRNNSVLVRGSGGVLLVDPGITMAELDAIATGLRESGLAVVAGFATHDHWDHVLWHADFGSVPRYGTAACAAALESLLSSADWREQLADGLPPEAEIPLDDLYGRITGVPAGTSHVPWDGPRVRILEHQAHARGHAALLVEEGRVLIAGDMLSDVLIPMLSFRAEDPLSDYLDGLDVLESASAQVVIPGHGSVGAGAEVQRRIDQDRAYVVALREGGPVSDSRIAAPQPGWEWVAVVHEGQAQRFAR
jgi:glyoxylase-like metal-dependent hydrolase (beta-lactamase superfamily II)